MESTRPEQLGDETAWGQSPFDERVKLGTVTIWRSGLGRTGDSHRLGRPAWTGMGTVTVRRSRQVGDSHHLAERAWANRGQSPAGSAGVDRDGDSHRSKVASSWGQSPFGGAGLGEQGTVTGWVGRRGQGWGQSPFEGRVKLGTVTSRRTRARTRAAGVLGFRDGSSCPRFGCSTPAGSGGELRCRDRTRPQEEGRRSCRGKAMAPPYRNEPS